jgi:RNA polymerase sigma-70 factor (sigma-E family)
MPFRSDRELEFTAFVLEHRAALVRTATLVAAGDAHRAEDAVQEALARFYAAWPRVSAELRFAYARRCVVNAVMTEHRRLFRRRERSAPELPDVAELPQYDSDVRDLFAAIADLPAGMRAAVVLRHVEGLSVGETANVLGCSVGNVKSQCARGLAQLKSRLLDRDVIPA